MAALQFFLLSLKDHKDAWERYLKLVRRAGLASYTELMQTAGLKVPFEGWLDQGHRPADGPVDRRASGVSFPDLRRFFLAKSALFYENAQRPRSL